MLKCRVSIKNHENIQLSEIRYMIDPRTRAASREKGPSDITNSVDPDQPLYDIENSYT